MNEAELDRMVSIVKLVGTGFVALLMGFWLLAEVAASDVNAAGSVKTFLAAFAFFFMIFLVVAMQAVAAQLLGSAAPA